MDGKCEDGRRRDLPPCAGQLQVRRARRHLYRGESSIVYDINEYYANGRVEEGDNMLLKNANDVFAEKVLQGSMLEEFES
eukprot:11947557-Heterocapsa_arctica.AAC.1